MSDKRDPAGHVCGQMGSRFFTVAGSIRLCESVPFGVRKFSRHLRQRIVRIGRKVNQGISGDRRLLRREKYNDEILLA